jgi:hypothetical protein
MNKESKKIPDNIQRNGAGYYVFFSASAVSFLVSLISLWQGILKVKSFSGEFEDWQQLAHSLLTFQNDGLILLAVSFFLLIISVQFSLYALLLKKK